VSVPLKSRVLLADDHAMVRRGLRHILDAEPDLEVVAEAGDGRQALTVTLGDDIDLAILDVAMPRLTGLQAARQIVRRRPRVKALMLSMHDNEQYFFEALRAGASGYVLKSAADRDLIVACRAAMRGEAFLYPGTERTLVREYLQRRQVEDSLSGAPGLTQRETEVVKLVAEGLSTRQIAEELVISDKTVQRHRANLLEKLGMHDRVELTRYAIRSGLVEA
jgi:DNA-binding NarL/FixJ family response regulator